MAKMNIANYIISELSVQSSSPEGGCEPCQFVDCVLEKWSHKQYFHFQNSERKYHHRSL